VTPPKRITTSRTSSSAKRCSRNAGPCVWPGHHIFLHHPPLCGRTILGVQCSPKSQAAARVFCGERCETPFLMKTSQGEVPFAHQSAAGSSHVRAAAGLSPSPSGAELLRIDGFYEPSLEAPTASRCLLCRPRPAETMGAGTVGAASFINVGPVDPSCWTDTPAAARPADAVLRSAPPPAWPPQPQLLPG